jgi:hypothetical protein
MAFVIDRSLYLSPEVVGEPLRSAPLEVKEDPFSLEALVAWLEKRDPNETYNWKDCRGHCLLSQYAAQFNLGRYGAFVLEWRGKNGWDVQRVARVMWNEPNYPFSNVGDALSRARKLLAEREK